MLVFAVTKRFAMLLGLTAVLGVTATTAKAELLAYEGFNYSGTAINGQSGGGSTGFSGAWSDTDGDFAHLSNDGVSLDSNVFPFATSGSRVSGVNGSATRNLDFSFDMASEGELYISVLLQKNSTSNSSSEYVQAQLGNTSGAVAVRFGLSSPDTTWAGLGSSAVTNSDFSIAADTAYFLVGKLVTHATANDEFYLNCYGTSDSLPTAEPTTWDFSASPADLTVSINQLSFSIGGGVAQGGEIDELRIGSTWNSVVPEPSSWALLLGVAAACLFGHRWRRIKAN